MRKYRKKYKILKVYRFEKEWDAAGEWKKEDTCEIVWIRVEVEIREN